MTEPAKIPVYDVIVVGGCADGLLLRGIVVGAEKIQLKRPDYIKPLASSKQAVPEIVNESDIYIIHPIGLTNDTGDAHLFGIAVVEGQKLTWGFSQLVISHVQNTTTKLIQQGLMKTH